MTKNIVLVTQEQNWEQDGGEHDPEAWTVLDADYVALQKMESNDPDENDFYDIQEILKRSTPITEFPVMIDAVMNIWFVH